MINSYIRSIGFYLPKNIITNFDLEKTLETNDDWITQRTGIKQRHIVTTELTSDMASIAGKQAIDRSGLDYNEIDMIIVATTTPDKTFPSTATIVQAKIGIKNGTAFDVQGVCSGFIYALGIANSFIKTRQAKNILVIGAESMSKIVDWSDRSTSILFGDGAGAVVLSTTDQKSKGIIDIITGSDGSYENLLYTDGGVCFSKSSGVIKMIGGELLKKAVDKMSDVTVNLLNKNTLDIHNIDYFIPHQANIRILTNVAKKLNLPEEKIVITIDKHANTSAASIPLAIAAHEKNIKSGDLIVLTAFGAGLTWGACLIRW